MDDKAKLEECTFILWEDYGHEGWKPRPFLHLHEVAAYVQAGQNQPFILTRRMPLRIEDTSRMS